MKYKCPSQCCPRPWCCAREIMRPLSQDLPDTPPGSLPHSHGAQWQLLSPGCPALLRRGLSCSAGRWGTRLYLRGPDYLEGLSGSRSWGHVAFSFWEDRREEDLFFSFSILFGFSNTWKQVPSHNIQLHRLQRGRRFNLSLVNHQICDTV